MGRVPQPYENAQRVWQEQAGVTAAETTFMTRVYGWMTLGLALTAVTAMFTATNAGLRELVFGTPMTFYGLIIGELVLVIALTAMIGKMSPLTAAVMFVVYSAVNGLTLSIVFLVYELGSVGTVFFITAGTFGVMSLFGWTTKRDLSGMGNLCLMALVGIILASIANWFLASSALYWAITYIGIIVFIGLIAYDTQKLKALGSHYGASGSAAARKASIMGALMLYLDFVNLLLLLLRVLGRRR